MTGAMDGERGDVPAPPDPVEDFRDYLAYLAELERLDDTTPADELGESLEDRRGYR